MPAGGNECRKISCSAARHEHTTGIARQSGKIGDPAQGLILRIDRTRTLEPRPGVDVRCGNDEVEQHRAFGRCTRNEGQEERMIDADARRGKFLDELLQHVESITPLGSDGLADDSLEFAQRVRLVERWRVHLHPLHRVLHDGDREFSALLVVEVHCLRLGDLAHRRALSTASRVGKLGTAPRTVVARAPAIAPSPQASSIDEPRASSAHIAPMKASPAPTVSIGVTGNGAIGVIDVDVSICAPSAPSVVTTVLTPAASNTFVPPSAADSVSFGATTSHSARSAAGSGRAGAGLSTVMAPVVREDANTASTVESGTSSWASTTRHEGNSIFVATPTEAFAPETTTIAFSPWESTLMNARPVGASTAINLEVSIPSRSRTARRPAPASSLPMQPTKAVLAPIRAHATA